MLLARTILGNIASGSFQLEVDFLQLEWFDTTKKNHSGNYSRGT